MIYNIMHTAHTHTHTHRERERERERVANALTCAYNIFLPMFVRESYENIPEQIQKGA